MYNTLYTFVEAVLISVGSYDKLWLSGCLSYSYIPYILWTLLSEVTVIWCVSSESCRQEEVSYRTTLIINQ